MKSNLIFLALTLHFCSATILVKFGKVPYHFFKNIKEGSTYIDPFEYFGLYSRQMLCDVAINAKQFKLEYSTKYYEERSGKPLITFTQWDPLDSALRRTMNYQRAVPTRNDPNPSCLKYQSHSVVVHRDPQYVNVKILQCVNTMNVKWYITFGFIDHFMYLLEPGQHRRASALRVTGLFEPSAIKANKSLGYFRKKFRTSVGMMKLYCRLGSDDTLRLCSAVFNALDETNNNEEKRYSVQRVARLCASKDVKESESSTVRVKVVPCTIFRENENSMVTRFFLLADSGDRSAMFVLYERGKRGLEMGARVTKIGALLNPVGCQLEKSETTKQNKRMNEEITSERDDETKGKFSECSRSKRKQFSPKKIQNHSSLRSTSKKKFKSERFQSEIKISKDARDVGEKKWVNMENTRGKGYQECLESNNGRERQLGGSGVMDTTPTVDEPSCKIRLKRKKKEQVPDTKSCTQLRTESTKLRSRDRYALKYSRKKKNLS